MSGEDVDEKREQLCLFVAASRKRLHAILKRFGWSERGVMEASDHILQDKDGATASEVLPLPASCSKDPAFSIQLDDSTIQGIVGTGGARRLPLPAVSFDDLQAGLDASERLLIYEHVLQHTKKHPQFQDNAAFTEVVGETRRERKKQRRHRKSKPTLNEELNQLVGLQMQALERQWQQEHDARLQKHRGRHNEQTQHRAVTERHQEHKGRHDEPVERFREHRGRPTGQTQHRERHNQQTERLEEHKDRGQRQVHRVWRHEHRDWHKHHSGSRQRSRSRSRSRERGLEKQCHGDRRREEREPRGHHHKKHRSHTFRH
ncbi:pre-mRNA-splicing factor 38B [Drosophila erecta]|uniref:Uncharacterized protein n=1 Tax=Drosophila erecta TaxID=7220 RepID=B3NVN7_DROER|nr:pre-mRNA-splicing factor 38B [Drosophila erecta]EDV46702.1 uncharacterized protein Dere_GG18054 [Drosophila erecta]